MHPRGLLQICEGVPVWDGEGPSPDETVDFLPCEDAIGAAVAWLDLDRVPERAWVSYTCFDGACPERLPDRAYVTIVTGDAARELAVVRRGNRLAIEGVRARPSPVAPSFDPPRPSRIDVGAAPERIARRTPLPSCGEERDALNDGLDTEGRECFLAGVLAGSPVEFVSHAPATEGGLVTTIYRFAGSGGLEVFVGVRGDWVTYRCGIALLTGDRRFGAGGRASDPERVE